MYDIAKEHRTHGEVKSTILESRVTTPFGKDYGFNCTCNKASTKFPKSTTTSKYYRERIFDGLSLGAKERDLELIRYENTEIWRQNISPPKSEAWHGPC
ncbi:hypothetical protein MTR_0005s0240 [Medicago truncatula]|uniref:Uncharacterized protein n=1 Tax=Medicago truncatula TaxID=3880 RepID=A0A072TJ71_MEDTR|nr:hypothetical protein MTR_0005s0240 [Medicago truncatula]